MLLGLYLMLARSELNHFLSTNSTDTPQIRCIVGTHLSTRLSTSIRNSGFFKVNNQILPNIICVNQTVSADQLTGALQPNCVTWTVKRKRLLTTFPTATSTFWVSIRSSLLIPPLVFIDLLYAFDSIVVFYLAH